MVCLLSFLPRMYPGYKVTLFTTLPRISVSGLLLLLLIKWLFWYLVFGVIIVVIMLYVLLSPLFGLFKVGFSMT